MLWSSIGCAMASGRSRQHLFNSLLQFFTSAPQSPFDGAFRHRAFAGYVAHALAGEIKILEQLRMRASKPREPPVHDRGCARILGGGRRLAFDEIEQRRLEELRSPVAEIADKGVLRDSNEPRQRVVWNPFRRPT